MGITRTVLLESADFMALFFAAFETITRCGLVMAFIVSPRYLLFQQAASAVYPP